MMIRVCPFRTNCLSFSGAKDALGSAVRDRRVSSSGQQHGTDGSWWAGSRGSNEPDASTRTSYPGDPVVSGEFRCIRASRRTNFPHGYEVLVNRMSPATTGVPSSEVALSLTTGTRVLRSVLLGM
jgi:hypothetical protein